MGLQLPGEFIPIFERNGFITKLTNMSGSVPALLQEWDQKGYPRINISVNVSRMDIYNVNLADVLFRTRSKAAFPPPACI
ncbi:MAG: hypothetical protein ACLRMZ_18770 [Blautia marasmi]